MSEVRTASILIIVETTDRCIVHYEIEPFVKSMSYLKYLSCRMFLEKSIAHLRKKMTHY